LKDIITELKIIHEEWGWGKSADYKEGFLDAISYLEEIKNRLEPKEKP
jgi:hypothetical protein